MPFAFCLSLLPPASAWLHWQPPQLQNHEQGVKLLLQAKPAEPGSSQGVSGKPPLSPLTITAHAGQIFTICSQQVRTDEDSTLLVTSDQPGMTPHQLILSHPQTTLHIEKPYPCPPEDISLLPYGYQGILYSPEPFLVTSEETSKQKEKNETSPAPFAGVPKTGSSKNLLNDGGGLGPDDDNAFKPPFQPPFAGQSDITLTLLPFLRLPPDWQDQLPGSQWVHWLFGEPDYDSAAMLNIQVNGETVARLPIHPWELREWAEDLTDSRLLLQKLAHRLNGRDTFIEKLLNILATEDQSLIDEETRERIEQQLADVLEQSDHTFSLDLEWFSLQAANSPDSAILTAKDGKDKKQGAGAGKTSGGSDQNQQGATGGQPSQSDQDNKESRDNQKGSDHPSPPGDNDQFATSGQAIEQYRLQVGDVFFAMEKSALSSGKKGFKKPNQIKVTREFDGVEYKLSDIEQYDPSSTASHLAGQGDALDYFLRYGALGSLKEYHRSSDAALPEDELAKASSTIIAALADRPRVVSLLKLSGKEPPLYVAVSQGLITCTSRLRDLHYPVDEPLPDGGSLLHIAVTNQDEAISKLLLNWAASPDWRRPLDGFSPFHLAIQSGYVNMAKLLAPYADKSIKTLNGKHSWQLVPALSRGLEDEQDALRTLVEIDRPDAPENFEGFIADIKAGNVAAVGTYTKQGIGKTLNIFYDSAIHHSHPEYDGMTPLQIAVQAGNPAIVKAILTYVQYGINRLGQSTAPEQLDGILEQPSRKNSELFRILNGSTKTTSEAPLHLAVKGVIQSESSQEKENYLGIIKELLANGVKPDIPRESDDSTPLFLAAKGGSFETVAMLMKVTGIDINRKRENDQATPLHAAVESGNIKLATLLLRSGANASAIMNKEGKNVYPLDIALEQNNAEMIKVVGRQSWFLFDYCRDGDVEHVRHYLDAGVPASLERTGSYSLLHQAVKGGNHNLIHLLVNNGADINKAYSDGMTPLHIAAERGPLSVVTALTHHNAEFRKNRNGKTPLNLALNNHQGQIAGHLLGHYFPIDSNPASSQGSVPQSQHPLIAAAIYGDMNFIEQLRHEGCLKGEMPVDKDGNTPLHLAAFHRQARAIPLLMISTDLHKALNKKLQTPLNVVFSTEDEATIEAFQPLMNPSLFWEIRNSRGFHVEIILNSEVHFDPVDRESGDYPLHVAARSGQSDSVRVLLKHRKPFSTTDLKNAAGHTPIDEALARLDSQDPSLDKKEFGEIVQQLLDAEDGHTFFQAARDNKTSLIERLLKARTDVNRVDRFGDSALHKAAKYGRIEAVQTLKARGAITDIRNSRGYTPCQLARQNRHREVARLLDDGASCPLL